MKKHIITFGTLILFVASGFALLAQDDVAARLAARRAAEAAGDSGAAAPPAGGDATATPATPATAATTTVSTGDATTTNATPAVDEDEVRRRTAIAAALKEAETNLSSMPTNLAAGLQIITRRNIFDPHRTPYDGVRIAAPAPRPVLVETFYLTGTADKIGKGLVAFFSGSGIPAYPSDHCIGETLNGFTIKDITWDGVKLVDTHASSSSNAEVDLQPTRGLTRNDGGPWRPAYSDITYTTVAPRMARMDGSEPPPVYQAQSFQPALMQPDFTPSETIVQYDNTYEPNTRTRGRQRQRGNAGGFTGGGNGAFAPAQPEAPAAPADPNVLLRLQQRRNAEQ